MLPQWSSSFNSVTRGAPASSQEAAATVSSIFQSWTAWDDLEQRLQRYLPKVVCTKLCHAEYQRNIYANWFLENAGGRRPMIRHHSQRCGLQLVTGGVEATLHQSFYPSTGAVAKSGKAVESLSCPKMVTPWCHASSLIPKLVWFTKKTFEYGSRIINAPKWMLFISFYNKSNQKVTSHWWAQNWIRSCATPCGKQLADANWR